METVENPTRRSFFKRAYRPQTPKQGQEKLKQAQPLLNKRLPWSIDEGQFLKGCTQCNDCIKVCDTQIIIRDQQGFPTIDFAQGQHECTFCNKCVDVCQQPIFIQSLNNKEINKNTIAQGVSDKDTVGKDTAAINTSLINHQKPWPKLQLVIDETCFPKNDIYCQSCRDICETSAISFIYTDSPIPKPTINLTDCTQCGACLNTCPQTAIKFDVVIDKNKQVQNA